MNTPPRETYQTWSIVRWGVDTSAATPGAERTTGGTAGSKIKKSTPLRPAHVRSRNSYASSEARTRDPHGRHSGGAEDTYDMLQRTLVKDRRQVVPCDHGLAVVQVRGQRTHTEQIVRHWIYGGTHG